MISRMARICLHAFMSRYVNPRRVARERVSSCDSPIVSPGPAGGGHLNKLPSSLIVFLLSVQCSAPVSHLAKITSNTAPLMRSNSNTAVGMNEYFYNHQNQILDGLRIVKSS